MMGFLFKPNATIAASTRSRPIQINVNFWMTQWASSSITNCFSSMHKPYWFFSNEFHCGQWIWLKVYCCLFKSWTGTKAWTRRLTCRPCSRIIRRLLLGCGREWNVGFLGHGGRRGIVGIWSRCRSWSWDVSQDMIKTGKCTTTKHHYVQVACG